MFSCAKDSLFLTKIFCFYLVLNKWIFILKCDGKLRNLLYRLAVTKNVTSRGKA
jgi:hypothetical protein